MAHVEQRNATARIKQKRMQLLQQQVVFSSHELRPRMQEEK